MARPIFCAWDAARIALATIAGLFCLMFGIMAGRFPVSVLACCLVVSAAIITLLLAMRATELRSWQILALAGLTGYILFNYGFANLASKVGGIPIVVGHAVMFAALILAIANYPGLSLRVLSEPAVLSVLALILLACGHLAGDVIQYGFMAVRDASLFLEGMFLLLGFCWAWSGRLNALLKWIFAVSVMNLFYCLSFPWAKSIQSSSPKSGIFLVVPVFGYHVHNYLYLLAGAGFCLWLAIFVAKWPRWRIMVLAGAQMYGLALYQARSMYVGIFAVLVLLGLMGEIRKAAQIAATAGMALLFLLFASLLGFQSQGRLGPVTAAFLQEHARGLFLEPNAPAVGTIYGRGEWYQEVWKRSGADTSRLFVGEGFGKPLIEFTDREGVTVRQPHNTHLTVLARLGLVGLVFWVLFHVCILRRFFQALRQRRFLHEKLSRFILWLFVFYVLSMIVTSVQPLLDFSYGAIPFYFLMGVALGLAQGPCFKLRTAPRPSA